MSYASNPDFIWLKRGDIIERQSNVGRTGGILFYYIQKDSEPTLLNGSIAGIERVVTRQQLSSNEIRQFISNPLSGFVLKLLGDDSQIINNSCIQRYKQYTQSKSLQKLIAGRIDDTTIRRLDKWSGMTTAKFVDSNWMLIFVSLTKEGSVEKWSLGGNISPFLLKEISRTVLADINSIPVIQELR